MASQAVLQSIIKLAQRLGARPGKFGGTRTNITFLGKGPSDELFNKPLAINELPTFTLVQLSKTNPYSPSIASEFLM